MIYNVFPEESFLKFQLDDNEASHSDLQLSSPDLTILRAFNLIFDQEGSPKAVRLSLAKLPISVIERGQLNVKLITLGKIFNKIYQFDAHPDFPMLQWDALHPLYKHLEENLSPGRRKAAFLTSLIAIAPPHTPKEDINKIHVYNRPFEQMEIILKDVKLEKLIIHLNRYYCSIVKKFNYYIEVVKKYQPPVEKICVMPKPFNPDLFFFKKGDPEDVVREKRSSLKFERLQVLSPEAKKVIIHYFQWGYCDVDKKTFPEIYLFCRKHQINDLFQLLSPYKQFFLLDTAKERSKNLLEKQKLPPPFSGNFFKYLKKLEGHYMVFAQEFWEVFDQCC